MRRRSMLGRIRYPRTLQCPSLSRCPRQRFRAERVVQTVGVRGQFSLTDWFGGMRQWGEVNWGDPLSLTYPLGGDGILEISLSKAVFNRGLFGLRPVRSPALTVKATFKLVKEASPIPEPLSILVWGGLGVFSILIAAARRRRK